MKEKIKSLVEKYILFPILFIISVTIASFFPLILGVATILWIIIALLQLVFGDTLDNIISKYLYLIYDTTRRITRSIFPKRNN